MALPPRTGKVRPPTPLLSGRMRRGSPSVS
jgi:hypothetical protein